MREKLLDLMKNEGLKPSQLAEMLGINPAGISHILAGRNKPGFELLQKILRRFPRINPDWLLLDSTKMYRDDNISASTVQESDLFHAQATPSDSNGGEPSQQPQAAESTPTFGNRPISPKSDHSAMIERIVIFYTDHTLESFAPKK